MEVGSENLIVKFYCLLSTVYCLLSTDLPNRLRSSFTGADSDALLEARDENLAVADFASTGACDNAFNAWLHEFVVHRNLQANFLKQVHFGDDATETLVVTLLLATAQHIGNGHLEYVSLVKGLLHEV